MDSRFRVNRRQFIRLGGAGAVGAGLLLGQPPVWADDPNKVTGTAPRPRTNIDMVRRAPRTARSLPGPRLPRSLP